MKSIPYRSIVLILALYLMVSAQASPPDRLEEWRSIVESYFAEELRIADQKGLFANDRTADEQANLIVEISSDISACWVDGYKRLSLSKSVPIQEIFVGSDGHQIKPDLFTHSEISNAMSQCVPDAFRNAGVELRGAKPNNALHEFEQLPSPNFQGLFSRDNLRSS